MSEYVVKRIKKRLKEAWENPQVPIDQKWALIESTMEDLDKHGKINADAIKKHDEEIEKHSKAIMEAQKKIAEVYENTYNNIIEL